MRVLVCGVAMASVLWWSSYPVVIAAVLISGLGSAIFHPEALVRARAVFATRPTTAVSVFFAGGNIGFAPMPLRGWAYTRIPMAWPAP
jgi:FSR family fosmidomycin resistance protein-like MFS transporter